MSNSSPQIYPETLDARAVLRWYDAHARDLPWRIGPVARARGETPDPYRVWLSEIMLQQTTVAAVGDYFRRFTALWPTVQDLAAAPLDAVLKQWAGLGYYARARNLHACAQAIVARHGGRFPASAAALLALPGIGPYTAAAVAAIAFDERVPVIDGNVERVMARYGAIEVPVREAKDRIVGMLADVVPPRAGDFAQALMDLGATICAPRAAHCLLCPLRPGCAGRRGEPLAFPVKASKPERPTRYGHTFVMRDAAGDVYLRHRSATGLLAKMTETPTSPWGDARETAIFPVPARWRRVGQVTHVFTHFRLELEVWTARVDAGGFAEGWWTSPAQLAGEALPTLFRKVLAAALDDSPEKRTAGPVVGSRR